MAFALKSKSQDRTQGVKTPAHNGKSARGQHAAESQSGFETPVFQPLTGGALQRKCACGVATSISGGCEECGKKQQLSLQTKLKVGEPGDAYEREADRVADQMMADHARPAVGGAPLRIQRFSGQSNGQVGAAPASVDHALASHGSPMQPALRQDMEQRFGYDFSRVRVHTGMAAEQSARDVNAHAYTVGQNIVFGAGRFAPGTREGRQLIAHELTHVAQQSGAELYVARRTARPPVRPPARIPYQQQQRHYGPTLPSPRRFAPVYPRLPKQGAPLTSQSVTELPSPFQIIAIATFAPNQLPPVAVLQDVSWEGPWGGKFDKDGTKTVEVGDSEQYTFAILDPPTTVLGYDQGAGAIDIGTSRQTTWDGYMIPVVSDLDAALVLPLDQRTANLFFRANPIKSRMKWDFLSDFTETRWAPVENIKIKEAISDKVTLTQKAKEQKEYAEMMKGLKSAPEFAGLRQPIPETPPQAEPSLMWRGKAVTIDSLRGIADRYPGGIDDPGFLNALLGSSEFSFSGSESARRIAVVALVVELQEKEQAEAGVAGAGAAPAKSRKRRRKCGRATGQSCPIWRPRLTRQHEYWNHAYRYRRDNQMLGQTDFNQNVAVLMLEGKPPIIEMNEMNFHSEQQIVWRLIRRGIDSGCPILGLFSERKPCQEICQRQVLPQLCRLNSGAPFDVFFATDYYNSPEGVRSQNNRHALIRSYAEAGYFEDF